MWSIRWCGEKECSCVMEIVFGKDFIEIDSKKISYFDLRSKAANNYINDCSYKYDFDTVIDNAAFYTHLTSFLNLKFFFENISDDCIVRIEEDVSREVYNALSDVCYGFERDCSKPNKIIVEKNVWQFLRYEMQNKMQSISAMLKGIIMTAYLAGLQVVYIQKKRKHNKSNKVCLIRSKAAFCRMNNRGDYEIFEENSIGKGSIYRCFSVKKRLMFLWKSLRDSMEDIKKIKNGYSQFDMEGTSCVVTDFYAWRLPHIHMWGYMVESILNELWVDTLISCNRSDGYAYVERKVAEKIGKPLVVYPHGIIGKNRFPHPENVSCVYVWTEEAQNQLNSFYKTAEFVFDEDIVFEMLSLENKQKSKNGKYVYFTSDDSLREDRENILKIEEILKTKGKALYVKLHPGVDRDLYEDIVESDRFIETVEEAVCDNVCIARYSSILVEGLYNGARSIELICNDADKEIVERYPSLQDPRLEKVYDLKDLITLLESK